MFKGLHYFRFTILIANIPIYHIEVLFGQPPSYAVLQTYAVFRGFFFHPKNSVIEGEYCNTKRSLRFAKNSQYFKQFTLQHVVSNPSLFSGAPLYPIVPTPYPLLLGRVSLLPSDHAPLPLR